MNDYISREAAIDAISNYMPVHARDALENAPAAEVIPGRLIPVEEQLPEPHKKVLAVREDGEVAIAVWNDNLSYWLNYWTSYQVRNVTHWMPLPEPPTEKGDPT